MQVRDALTLGSKNGLQSLDSELLVLFALNRTESGRSWLRTHGSDHMPSHSQLAFSAACVARQRGTPLAYITGQKPFYGLDLHIDPRVLDPRPDTETLVDWALELLQPLQGPHIADLGTGSGAVALAIQHQRPDATVVAVDASADALDVARGNAERLNLAVTFAHGNWLDPLPDGQQHLIASNPPYIAEGDPHLPALRHEPIMALTSGPDGLDAIRHIVAEAPRALRPGGWLLLEHGFDQGDRVHALLEARGYLDIDFRRDLGNHVRCTGGRWPGAQAGGATGDN